MTNSQSLSVLELRPVVYKLHLKYGLWRVVWALLAAAIKRHLEEAEIRHMSNRQRRDAGLPELEDDPGKRTFMLWDIRL
jgi:hypothetical protein